METCHGPPPGVARVPAPRPRLQPFCLCLCGLVQRRSLWPRRIRLRCVVNPGAGAPKTLPGADAGKRPEVAWEVRLPRRGVRPGSPLPWPRFRHSPMSPSSSSSSSSSMFSRTFLVIICMSPGDRHSAALGSARLRSAPLGSGRKLRSALSALPRCAPPALCFSRRCSACD